MKKIFTHDNKPLTYIFRTTITIGGKKIYARDHGKKAFRIPVYRDPNGNIT